MGGHMTKKTEQKKPTPCPPRRPRRRHARARAPARRHAPQGEHMQPAARAGADRRRAEARTAPRGGCAWYRPTGHWRNITT